MFVLCNLGLTESDIIRKENVVRLFLFSMTLKYSFVELLSIKQVVK